MRYPAPDPAPGGRSRGTPPILRALAVLLTALALAGPAEAQTATPQAIGALEYRVGLLDAELSDIRARLRALSPDGTGAGPVQGAGRGSGDLSIRLDRLEVELSRLTGLIEEMGFRQRRIAEDAGRRFGDIEFRLTELEGGDISQLPPQEPLGGAPEVVAPPEPARTPQAPRQAPADPVQVPQGERTDLDLAVADIQQGRFDQGEDRLQRFLESYPGSPLTARARYWLGQSHFTRGNYSDAARSFLAGYQVEQTGDLAARNLLHLGITLGRLGQQREACLTLREVRSRFVSGDASILNAADSEADRLACGR